MIAFNHARQKFSPPNNFSAACFSCWLQRSYQSVLTSQEHRTDSSRAMVDFGTNSFGAGPVATMNGSGNPFDPFGSVTTPTAASQAGNPPVQGYQQYNPAAGMVSPAASAPPGNFGAATPASNIGFGSPQSQPQASHQQVFGQSYGAPQPPASDATQQQYPMVQQQHQQPFPGMQYEPLQQQQPPPPQQQQPFQHTQQPVQNMQPQFMQQQQQQQQQQYGQQFGATAGQVQQQPAPAPSQGYDPFGSNAAMTANDQNQNQLVVSSQQSNPYAGVVAPTPAPVQNSVYGSQALVPATEQNSQWGMPQGSGTAPSNPYASQSSTSFDPFAAPPAPPPVAPPPVAPPAPPPAPTPAAPYAAHPSQSVQNQNPFGAMEADQAQAPPPAPTPAARPPPPPEDRQIVKSDRQTNQYHQAPGGVSERSQVTSRALVPAGSQPSQRNPYSREIAKRAPPGASPLPKAELVRNSGYVLSRISFRTIVMKKWKQSYWVQYGSHTMLWFRSQSDFDDWLNNPYHSQAQRNFLIKLAVNFVHDLYKPNVRGYQVTQCRSKPYGTKMVRQFKLERWMDYGPTIAAAFGSYDPKEVDKLREAIVQCMRNTPLDGGIRATGAVRQYHEQNKDGPNNGGASQRQQPQGNGSSRPPQNPSSGASVQSYQPHRSAGPGTSNPSSNLHAARSVVSAGDLLDDHKMFDETASYPGGSAALVPVHAPNSAYPGAPPARHMSHQSFPGQYQQTYPGHQQQQPPPTQTPHGQQQQQQAYGAPPPQNYAAPQQGYHAAQPSQQHYQQQFSQQNVYQQAPNPF